MNIVNIYIYIYSPHNLRVHSHVLQHTGYYMCPYSVCVFPAHDGANLQVYTPLGVVNDWVMVVTDVFQGIRDIVNVIK